MRKFFIYISLITLTATFTLGESFAAIITSSITEDVDFAKEKETEIEEEYSEAVLENENIQLSNDVKEAFPHNFSEQSSTAFFDHGNVVKEHLFLLHCCIIR